VGGAVKIGGFLKRRSVILSALLAVLLLGAWFWLRDSSLVAIKRITITGVSGPDAPQIRAALSKAARNMTTLHIRMDQFHMAVGPYPVVKYLQADTSFPHSVRIRVIEEIPVATVTVAGRATAVAGDGTLLRDMRPSPQLPVVPVGAPPGGSRLSQPDALHAVTLLGAAPYQLLSHIEKVTTQPQHGLVAQLRSGPSVYFGDPGRFAAKWVAAGAVLADAGSAGAAYLDVSDPERPVAGGGSGSTGTSATAGNSSLASSPGAGASSGTGPSSAGQQTVRGP
jgi:cell division protein FtsQ